MEESNSLRGLTDLRISDSPGGREAVRTSIMITELALEAPRVAAAQDGIARQYRVQICTSIAAGWQKFGVYTRRSQAIACVERLQAGGYPARMLDVRVAPAAG